MAKVDREAEGRRYSDGYYGEILWDEESELWIVPSRSDPDRVHFVNTELRCTCWDSQSLIKQDKEELCAHARGVARKAVKEAAKACRGVA